VNSGIWKLCDGCIVRMTGREGKVAVVKWGYEGLGMKAGFVLKDPGQKRIVSSRASRDVRARP